MQGNLVVPGMFRNAGFMNPSFGDTGISPGPSIPILTRGAQRATVPDELKSAIERLQGGDVQRAEVTGDLSQILLHLNASMEQLQRGITSGMTAFPVRENLEAEATSLVPMETPLRNRLTRRPGAGTASAWKQLTSIGGGWATSLDQPGSAAAVRAFFAENGAPAEHTSVYADKSAGYKLLGTFGSVTGFAQAAGANFMNQLATEKTNAINNLMLNEENALINGDSTSTAAPWGDATTAFAFDGIIPLTATANGVPAAQIQAAVGALTKAHIDAQLTRLWKQGARNAWMLMNAQESNSLVHLAEADGTILRVMATASGDAILGVKVTGYKHPVTGEIVPILVDRFMPAGTIVFGADQGPDGRPAIDVEVLPQVQLPELAPNQSVQGYTAQELAPTTAAPQVYPFIVTVYEVLRMKNANVFAKSSGLTAV
jgi:class 3 adenylate cyclase